MENQNKNYLLPMSIIIGAVLISGSIFFVMGKNSPNPDGDLAQVSGNDAKVEITSRDVVLGDPNAPISFIEYADFQCPFCGRHFIETEKPLRELYVKTGKVKMVSRNFAFLGPESFAAAEAAECAKDQSQFWAYRDALYEAEVKDGKEHNGNLNRELFMQIATDLKMDTAAFGSCVDSKKYADQVKKESDEARQFGVQSTPTIFINGQKIEGAFPIDDFKKAIDDLLTKV
jgi:protein-disulfide isomerase